jgi:hypothetical protein
VRAGAGEIFLWSAHYSPLWEPFLDIWTARLVGPGP